MSEQVIQTEQEKEMHPILKWFSRNSIQLIFGIVIAFWCILYVGFFVWGVISSFKDPVGFAMDPIGISLNPIDWAPNNYITALQAIKKILPSGETVFLPTMLWNSLLYCVGNALFPNIMLCFATYIVNKYKHFRWTQILWVIFVITNYVPFNSDLGSELKMLRAFEMYNTMWGNWIYNCGAFGAGFLLYLGCWRSISNTYIEAAEIDGAGPLTMFFKVMFPQTMGLLLVLFLTRFSGLWNDYMSMLIYIPGYPTIASGAFEFQFSVEPGASDITVKLAGLFAFSLPVMLMYFMMRSKLVKAMSMAGGLKG